MDPHRHPAVTAFLQRFSSMMALEGLPVPAGRMLGLLFVQGRDLTAEELARQLSISRSNVSTTVRLLETLGLVERFRLPGERKDRFRLPEEPFRPLLGASVVRAVRMRDSVLECREELPPELLPAGERLGDLARFFGFAADWLARMHQEWTPEAE